ncbi:MAG: hypothetical protein U0694_13965 [Anaerolineae bacterium]
MLFALLLVGGVLLAFPQPRFDPRFQLVRFTVGIGDMFITRQGQIAPPENPYEVLSEHRLGYDDEGFRIPARSADTYDIVALGDSYTEAANAARPLA